jgi:hypothetical protein
MAQLKAGSTVGGSGIATKNDNQALQAQVNDKQDTLVSGSNIKTVNGQSLIGSGDVKIRSRKDYVRTTLFSGRQGSGPISLSQNWDNFDELIFYGSHDNGDYAAVERVDVVDIIDAALMSDTNDFLIRVREYWRFDIADKSKINTMYENSIIFKVIGVTW